MMFRTPLLALALLSGFTGLDRAVAPSAQLVQEVPRFSEQAPLAAVFACYERAYDGTKLDATSITRLCHGAADEGPADCFIAAHADTGLSNDDAITLCRCAPSAEPVQCYGHGEAVTRLGSARVLALCAPEERFDLDAECRPPLR